jgi:hypothetical protein
MRSILTHLALAAGPGLPEPSGLAQEGQIPSGKLGITQGIAGLAGSSSKQAKRVGEPGKPAGRQSGGVGGRAANSE